MMICTDSTKAFQPLHIFVSYGHDEHAVFAQRLASDVRARGHEAWYDLNRLKPGGDWEQYIEEGLLWAAEKPGIGRLILIMTPHSVRKPDGYCLNEISRALDLHLPIIPIMLVWSSPPLTINRIQWLDMQFCSATEFPEGRYKEALYRIFDALEHQKLAFEGQASLLKANLNPLSFEADINYYQKWFTGRKWVFDKIEKWLNTQNIPRLFWISGLPGIGKTAIAIQLIQLLENVSAFHLCRRGNSEKASPRRAIMSIAYQLSTQLPDYADRLAGINLTQLLSGADINVATLFDTLIVQQLASDIKRPVNPRIILIDGLDEATYDGHNLLAEFIAQEFIRLPDWLRIIITSRPDPEVLIPLQGWDRWVLETEDPQNRDDLEAYIKAMLFSMAPEGISETALKAIVDNSEGIFLYAEWICREIRNGHLSLDSPEEFPKGLGGIFLSFFKQKLTREDKYKEDIDQFRQQILPSLELILAAREPLALSQLSLWLGWNRYDQESFFKKLGALFFLDSKQCIRPFHTSVSDWLCDPPKAGDFFVDEQSGHQKLTEYLWKEYEQKGVQQLSDYAIRHLPAHLIKAERWDNVVDLLCDLEFIQAKAAARLTFDLMKDFNDVMKCIPDNAENIQKEQERQKRLKNYSDDLVLYAKGEIGLLEVPDSLKPWSQNKINAEVERIRTKPTRLDRLRSFHNFLGQEAGTFQEHACEIPALVVQQAWNNYNDGPVGKAAEKAPLAILEKLILRTPTNRLVWNPLPPYLNALKGHTDTVYDVVVTLDGKKALSASMDGTCILWDLESGNPSNIIDGSSEDGYKSSINAVAITANGKNAVSASDNGSCIHWDLGNGKIIKIFEGHTSSATCVSITPDGKKAISGSWDRTCILWDLSNGELIRRLQGHFSLITAVAITPDGKIAVSASWDRLCILWDLESGNISKTLRGHSASVNAVVITPNGMLALSASSDKTCILWDLGSGNPIKKLTGHTDPIYALAMTPDGKKAISVSDKGTFIFWNLENGKPIKTFTEHTEYVHAIAITPDGKNAVSASKDKTCILWDLETGNPLKEIKGHTNRINAVEITRDGEQVISASDDGTCILWELRSDNSLKTLRGHTGSVVAVATTPNGKQALSASADGTCILWDLKNCISFKTLKKHTNRINAVAITPDGKHALSASADGICILWDLESSNPVNELKDNRSFFTGIAVNPDGKNALLASADGNCLIWDLKGGNLLKTLKGHTKRICDLAITPDGKQAVSASADGISILWDLENGSSLKTLKKHHAYVRAIAISSGGKQAILASSDGTCILWDFKSGNPIKTLSGHTNRINAVAITPDENHAVTVSNDGTCILWNLEAGIKIAQFFAKGILNCLSINKNCLVIGGKSGELHILKMPDINF